MLNSVVKRQMTYKKQKTFLTINISYCSVKQVLSLRCQIQNEIRTVSEKAPESPPPNTPPNIDVIRP